MIVIVNYGLGNVQAIANIYKSKNVPVSIASTAEALRGADHIILPGVGAFGYCAERLRGSGFLPALTDWTLVQRRPILGICVGMQLLADTSEELGEQQGLGWLGGKVQKLVSTRAEVRIPHVGWNEVSFQDDFGECARGSAPDFYFDHSYAYMVPVHGTVLGTCEHGQTFCAAVRHHNILGVQFHPEKSQEAGRRFLRAFLAI